MLQILRALPNADPVRDSVVKMSCCSYWCWAPVLGLCAYFLVKYISSLLLQKKLDRWKDTPRDVVILHGFTRGRTLPNNSPFVLKLETYMRMAKIKYEFDCTDPFGPKGKTPWISYNGEHVADSQLVMEFLEKKVQPKYTHSYSEAELAIAKAFRITSEEHFFWGVASDRFIWHGAEFMNMSINSSYKALYRRIAVFYVKWQTNAHGIGRHSKEEFIRLTCDDLRAVSAFLGKKKFLLGDEPCPDDCGVFGQLAQAVWSLPNSEYEKLVNGELKNLKEYCIRMKERFYPDWEKCLG